MQRRRHLAFCVSAFLLTTVLGPMLLAGAPAGKGIPDAKAQAKVEALLQELFKEDYAKAAQDPVARVRLANTFLTEGRETDDDRAGRYVLFRGARDLAARAGDAPVAFQAIEDLAKDFGLTPSDVFQMKINALMTASKAVASPDAYYTVVDSALVLLEDALAADNFEAAQHLADTAKAAAVKLRNVPLVYSVVKRQDEVARLQKEYEHWKPFAETLAKNPKDPKANTEMGKYQAFRKGNWDVGLVLLSRGDHEGLRYLATMELKHPEAAGAQLALAKGWEFAADQAPEERNTQILLRAYYWSQQAMPQLEGKAQRDVEKRMLAIIERVPPEFRVGEIVEEYRRYDGNTGPVYGVAFSPDGRKAVFGGADNVLHLWDTK